MKKQWTSFATAALIGAAVLFSSCGGDNRESTPDSTSIETGDTNRDARRDTTGDRPSGGTGTNASGTTTTGTTSGSTTGGTTM